MRQSTVRGLAAVATALVLTVAVSDIAAQQTVGLFQKNDGVTDGYALFSPRSSGETYLLNNDGHVVHSWTSAHPPGQSYYLLPDGHLLRGAQIPQSSTFVNARGHGGRIEEFDWDGNLVWAYEVNTSSRLQHHDIVRLPNGNTLLMAWEHKSSNQAIAAGRNPATIPNDGVWNEVLLEIRPTGPDTGEVVWEWSAWDHMIQDFDAGKDNFGIVADHPELIDINAVAIEDFIHMNGIDYDPVFDHVIVSVREYSEYWVIDHSTTTAEAAGHAGGRYDKGGDLLYRWGNPQIYGRGTGADQVLEHQHDSHWIEEGRPGAGNIIVFNNSDGRGYSSIEEVAYPADVDGVFPDPGAGAHGPAAPVWTYVADPPSDLFSPIISGADRLPNGNTIVTEGVTGRFVEVTSAGDTVWEYVNPIGNTGPLAQGTVPTLNGIAQENAVFKIRKYPADHAAFTGRELSPRGPLEGFVSPSPAGDGAGGTTPLTAIRLSAAGDQIEVRWDAATCQQAVDYNLIWGHLADVSAYTIAGAECAIGVGGAYSWATVPADDVFFLVVGVDATGVYESRWGDDGAGNERNGAGASFRCGATTKDLALSCP